MIYITLPGLIFLWYANRIWNRYIMGEFDEEEDDYYS